MGIFDRLLSHFSGRNAEDATDGAAGNATRAVSEDDGLSAAADTRHPTANDPSRTPNALAQQGPANVPGFDEPAAEWEELPAYLPVDPADHPHVTAISTALAAFDRPQASYELKSLSVANPEFQLVSCIAAALAAGALEASSFQVKKIYKKRVTEEPHAA